MNYWIIAAILSSIIAIGATLTAIFDAGIRHGWWTDELPEWDA